MVLRRKLGMCTPLLFPTKEHCYGLSKFVEADATAEITSVSMHLPKIRTEENSTGRIFTSDTSRAARLVQRAQAPHSSFRMLQGAEGGAVCH